MSEAFGCDICHRFFVADQQNGAHTTLWDNIDAHTVIDICPECTQQVVNFVNQQIEFYKQQAVNPIKHEELDSE